MVYRIRKILLPGCLLAGLVLHLPAQSTQDKSSAGPVPAVPRGSVQDSVSANATAAPTTAQSDYPLDAFPEFSAIMVGSLMTQGEDPSEGHIYRSGNLIRMEGPEEHGYFITDLTTHETYGISAGPCMHDSHPYFRASPFAASRPNSKIVRVVTGKEILDGHSCQIEDITVSASKPGGLPLKMRFWEAEDLQGFPIKVEYLRPNGANAIVRYKNVVIGPQDPTLFIHPKSCQSLPQRPGAAHRKASTKSSRPAAVPAQQ